MWEVFFKIYNFDYSTLSVFILKNNGTKRPFLENCGLLSAIRQQKMVKLIISTINIEALYMRNIIQHLEF